MSEIEKQHGIRPFRSKLRGIRAISFDHVFNETYLGVMTTELCCVFDVRAPTAPIHVLSTQFCRPFLKSNLPTPFRSFAFCGNGCLLVLTDKDIFRWNYLEGTSTHLPSLFTHTEHSSFRKIEFKSAGQSDRSIFPPAVTYRGAFHRQFTAVPLQHVHERHDSPHSQLCGHSHHVHSHQESGFRSSPFWIWTRSSAFSVHSSASCDVDFLQREWQHHAVHHSPSQSEQAAEEAPERVNSAWSQARYTFECSYVPQREPWKRHVGAHGFCNVVRPIWRRG